MSNAIDISRNIYLLGDSITQGLGSKKINFTEYLQDLLGGSLRVVNLALTGTTIEYPLELLSKGEIPLGGGCYVILYGNVDAQIRPSRDGFVFTRIPRRFQGGGMLMPRPFYSSDPLKSVVQHAENLTRKALSSLIVAIDGTEQWVDVDSFAYDYSELLETLAPSPCICCSTVHIDGRLFKGTPEQYHIFDGKIADACRATGAEYLDLSGPLREAVESGGWDFVYNKDHFHPNAVGYELMAELIAFKILGVMGNEACQ